MKEPNKIHLRNSKTGTSRCGAKNVPLTRLAVVSNNRPYKFASPLPLAREEFCGRCERVSGIRAA